ncbi:hypothetical protein GGR52DRAFT_574675 [Hypoxylon sp. FL1284]|nr:hypothetical protein GGR52DRAFT_574675 [Hypoxylon sp. FL1284]
MSSQQEYDSLRIQPIEYPDGSNHLPEVHESNHLPEVHESNHPPKTPEYRPAPAADIMEPGDIYQHRRISENRNPFGLGPLAFGAIIALITALVVGAAVGGASIFDVVLDSNFINDNPNFVNFQYVDSAH